MTSEANVKITKWLLLVFLIYFFSSPQASSSPPSPKLTSIHRQQKPFVSVGSDIFSLSTIQPLGSPSCYFSVCKTGRNRAEDTRSRSQALAAIWWDEAESFPGSASFLCIFLHRLSLSLTSSPPQQRLTTVSALFCLLSSFKLTYRTFFFYWLASLKINLRD